MADGLISVNIDISDAVSGLETLDGELNYAGRRLVQRAVSAVERQARRILLDIFEQALAEAGDSFPAIYANHLRQGLEKLNFVVEPYDSEIAVSFEDIEELGDWGDIINATHYHAILDVGPGEFSVSNPPLSNMGEDIDALYGPNHEDNRQNFWETLVVGGDYIVHFGTEAKGWTGVVSTAGMYEETLNARVQFWGSRYPEWIILDEGMDGTPGSPPTHFVSLVGPAIEEYILNLLEPEIVPTYEEAIVEAWDRGQHVTARFDPHIGAKGGYRAPSGRFAKKA